MPNTRRLKKRQSGEKVGESRLLLSPHTVFSGYNVSYGAHRMNLPNREHAIVEPEKVRNYLLNIGHPDGFGKAAFFSALGFQPEDWGTLANVCRQVTREANL